MDIEKQLYQLNNSHITFTNATSVFATNTRFNISCQEYIGDSSKFISRNY